MGEGSANEINFPRMPAGCESASVLKSGFFASVFLDVRSASRAILVRASQAFPCNAHGRLKRIGNFQQTLRQGARDAS